MSDFQAQLKSGALVGVKKGWSSFVWICKITIPISLLVTLLHWTGWLDKLDVVMGPLMSLINLPPAAALPILSGILLTPYATIAAMAVLPFTIEQMTLISIFVLICHSLIMEGIIQHKSGLNAIKATLFRIIIASLTVFIASQFFGDTSQSVVIPAELSVHTPLLEVMKNWAVETIILLLKILGIVMFILIALEVLNSVGWLEKSLKFFRPLMKVCGLPDRGAMMFVAGIVFGLVLASAVIMGEAKKGLMTKEELECSHISIGINHSIIEEPVVFSLLGINILWLIIPKLLASIITVQAYRGALYLKKKVGW
ncbi:MAG TPA: nucleoside recognition domain-containing protein [Dehalococcoidales bacterium]|nr:nucleoside recognition domain-containing protein [Dehalococcoidales bacterium]